MDELARWKELATRYEREKARLLGELATLREENRLLKEAVYGPTHKADCPALQGAGPCDCLLFERTIEWRNSLRAEMELYAYVCDLLAQAKGGE